MNRKTIFMLIGMGLVIALGVGAWVVLSSSNVAATAAAVDAPGFTITADDRTQGNPKAPVTLIEYAALVCPHCAEFNLQDFPLLKASYIDTGKVFYVFRIYPIRPGDGPAEKLASCMPKDRYFSVADLLFRNQPKWDADEYPGADIHSGLMQMGRIAGMSAGQVDACISSTAEDARINKVGAEGETRYHLTGTPTFIVDGMAGPAGEVWPALQKRLDAAVAAKSAAH